MRARGLTVTLTREPLFTAKATLLPGAAFAVGWDTAVRILDPKYVAATRRGRPAGIENVTYFL
jgi:hypothetical protein